MFRKEVSCIFISLLIATVLSCRSAEGLVLPSSDGSDYSLPSMLRPGKNNINVVWIILDACRRDHLSCYGYHRVTSPQIDNLAGESVLFDQAVAQSTTTNISFASFLTGQYPARLGFYGKDYVLNDLALTLPEILKIYGYETAAFVTGPLTHPIYGLHQGFDVYYHPLINQSAVSSARMSFKDCVPAAFQWLEKQHQNKFFALVHGNDTHFPYDIDESYNHFYGREYQGIIDYFITNQKLYGKGMVFFEAIKENVLDTTEMVNLIDDPALPVEAKRVALSPSDISHIKAHYDGAVRYADCWVGQILDKLTELKLDKNTMVILSADHGEELGEHGYFGHHNQRLYDEIIRVPLIIRLPDFLKLRTTPAKSGSLPPDEYRNGVSGGNYELTNLPAGRQVTNQVELIDLMPTILALLDIPQPNEIQGKSLLPLISFPLSGNLEPDRSKPGKYAFSEGGLARWSVRTNSWKLIYNSGSEPELYNLRDDPDEVENLVQSQSEFVCDLSEILTGWRRQNKISELKSAPAEKLFPADRPDDSSTTISSPSPQHPFRSEEVIIK